MNVLSRDEFKNFDITEGKCERDGSRGRALKAVITTDVLFDLRYELVREGGHCTNSRGLNPNGKFTDSIADC